MKLLTIDKYKTFPDIKDWSNPQNEFRYMRDTSKMTYKQWFWFHPTAYILLSFGSLIISFFIWVALLIYFVIRDIPFMYVFSGLVIASLTIAITRKSRKFALERDVNFYDIFMREW